MRPGGAGSPNVLVGGNGAIGGNASATASGTSLGAVNVHANAIGGSGTGGQYNGAATATASGSGASGVVATLAQSAGGAIVNIQTTASAGIGSDATVESHASVAIVGGPAYRLANAAGLQSASFATVLPTPADVALALAGSPNVSGIIGSPSDVLGLVVLGGGFSSGDTHLYQAEADFSIDTTQLPNLFDLKVGFLDSLASGNGFDKLEFKIVENGVVVLDKTFTDLASAEAFFDDKTLDLGNIGTGATGGITSLSFIWDLTASTPGDGFAAEMLFANSDTNNSGPTNPTPEPSTWMLACIGFGGLLAYRRFRKRLNQTVTPV